MLSRIAKNKNIKFQNLILDLICEQIINLNKIKNYISLDNKITNMSFPPGDI